MMQVGGPYGVDAILRHDVAIPLDRDPLLPSVGNSVVADSVLIRLIVYIDAVEHIIDAVVLEQAARARDTSTCFGGDGPVIESCATAVHHEAPHVGPSDCPVHQEEEVSRHETAGVQYAGAIASASETHVRQQEDRGVGGAGTGNGIGTRAEIYDSWFSMEVCGSRIRPGRSVVSRPPFDIRGRHVAYVLRPTCGDCE